ncbi:MAG: stage V sporulation protein E [Clostridiales bacterium]|mgnify:CR=1 FL=1|nr:stage V sporulation protein E [Clostridiales bacterium]
MRKRDMDYSIMFTTLILVCIGVVMVFSASFYYAQQKFGDSYYFFKRQGIWAIMGLGGMVFMSKFDYHRLRKFSWLFLIGSFALLILVLIVGVPINNAKRWLQIGPLSLQPSEVAKISLIVFLADYLSKDKKRPTQFIKGVIPTLAIMGGLAALIMEQPNMSTAMVVGMIGFAMLFLAGAKMWHLIGLVSMGVVGAVVLINKAEYRLERILAFQDPWSDPRGKGYQPIQSLYSLGSGGWFGMGLGASRQKFLYLPYRETDYIFAIIGEEIGFIGSIIVILIFFTLIWRGIKVAITAPDLFGTLLASGIISMIGIQTIINIAVVTNSMPPTGVPLPFISYGGSSLFLFMSSIGVVLNISKYSKAG